MSNSVKNLFEKIKKDKRWTAGFIVSALGLVVAVMAFVVPLFPIKQSLKPIRICYVNAEKLSEFKEIGEIGGKKVNIIENEIINIVEKWTLPDSHIGFLIIEVEKNVNLSITNLNPFCSAIPP